VRKKIEIEAWLYALMMFNSATLVVMGIERVVSLFW
jgi:hypothetical protein